VPAWSLTGQFLAEPSSMNCSLHSMQMTRRADCNELRDYRRPRGRRRKVLRWFGFALRLPRIARSLRSRTFSKYVMLALSCIENEVGAKTVECHWYQVAQCFLRTDAFLI
jgi:hypothetical protein